MTESKKWKMWRAVLDVKTCKDCREKHGKIYQMSEIVKPRPPLHICIIEKMKVILAGNATHNGTNGADWYLKYYGKLPDYYLSKEEAKSLGIIEDNKIPPFIINFSLYFEFDNLSKNLSNI